MKTTDQKMIEEAYMNMNTARHAMAGVSDAHNNFIRAAEDIINQGKTNNSLQEKQLYKSVLTVVDYYDKSLKQGGGMPSRSPEFNNVVQTLNQAMLNPSQIEGFNNPSIANLRQAVMQLRQHVFGF
jgi:hypothetical protein